MRHKLSIAAGTVTVAAAAAATLVATSHSGGPAHPRLSLAGSDPHASIAAAPNGLPRSYAPAADAPSGTVYLPNLGYELRPISTGVPPGSSVSSANAALELIKIHGGMPDSAHVVSQAPTIAFGSFTDTTSGIPQGDGALKLSDAGEPAWLFTWPLAKPEPNPAGAPRLPGTGPAPSPQATPYTTGDCVWYVVVTTSGDSPRQGQTCRHDPAVAAVMTIGQ